MNKKAKNQDDGQPGGGDFLYPQYRRPHVGALGQMQSKVFRFFWKARNVGLDITSSRRLFQTMGGHRRKDSSPGPCQPMRFKVGYFHWNEWGRLIPSGYPGSMP